MQGLLEHSRPSLWLAKMLYIVPHGCKFTIAVVDDVRCGEDGDEARQRVIYCLRSAPGWRSGPIPLRGERRRIGFESLAKMSEEEVADSEQNILLRAIFDTLVPKLVAQELRARFGVVAGQIGDLERTHARADGRREGAAHWYGVWVQRGGESAHGPEHNGACFGQRR